MVLYFRPTTLDEALAIRAEREVSILAGGTDIYPARANRAAWGDPAHADVLDIGAIPGLDAIEETEDAVRFGCCVTWSALAGAALPPEFDGYRAAAREVGGRQVQNRATLVGNLCTASPAGDGIPNLIALDARVALQSRSGRREVPVAAFIDRYRHNVCRPDEIVTALVVPKLPSARSGFVKLGARHYLVISIAMAAAVVATDAGRITDARVAVGACSAVACRLPALESRLIGRPLATAAELVEPADVAALTPIDDVRASAAYRIAAAERLVRDVLSGLATSERRGA
jgi:xanthine dehydrogenase small subunit